MKARIVGGALCLSLLAGAGAARAQAEGVSDCVWAATTPAMRDTMRAALRRHGDLLENLTDPQISGLMCACRLTNTTSIVNIVFATLRARTLILEAQEGLKASLGLDDAALGAGWRALPAADRRSLARASGGGFTLSDTASTGLSVWAASLGVRSEADQNLLFDYAVGRALMDAIGDR